MKKLILVLLVSIPTFLLAQADSGLNDSAQGLRDSVTNQDSGEPDTPENDTTVTGNKSPNNNAPCACIPQHNILGGGEWILVFLPAIIFISLAWVLFSKGLRKFNFSEALKENELTTITIQNPLYQNSTDPLKVRDLPPTIEVTANVKVTDPTGSGVDKQYSIDEQPASYRASISRYIALISSLMIIVLAVALSSFFVYHYIRTSCPPVLQGLSSVLIALGLGVVPYAANKISTAVKSNKSEA